MIHNKNTTTPAVAAVQPVNHHTQSLLKIALDVHLAWHVIAVQEDGVSPKPPQRFKPADFLKWVKQQADASAE